METKDKQIQKIGNMNKKNFNIMLFITFFIGVLFIVSAYAWFQASLDVQVKFINLVVSKKNGLFISLDGIEFGSSIEISEKTLINDLKNRYPGNTSQWAKNGLYPISSNGIPNSNSSVFDMYIASDFQIDELNNKRYLSTRKKIEKGISNRNDYISFDIFLKNITGSPVSDNLYIDEGTNVILEDTSSEQNQGLINSVRIGFVKIGTVSNKASVEEIQNISCNNNCEMLIYEPNSTLHTNMSINKAKRYGIDLKNGQYFPTYAIAGTLNFFEISDVVSGDVGENFELQNTVVDIDKPIFEIPDGVTKVRIYVWIEGQDIDSLETRSDGASAKLAINLIKDTAGFDAFNE